jgi:hypothetical protein
LDSHSLKWPVGVVFIATIQFCSRWRSCWRWAHRTVRCTPDSPVPLPRHHCRWILTVGASDFWARLDVRCTPDMYCSLSGAPVRACLTTARLWRALNAPAGDRWRGGSRCSVVHRTVRCTPDSPVNFSGAAEVISRGWRVPEAALPWSTGHCPVYTGQSGEL